MTAPTTSLDGRRGFVLTNPDMRAKLLFLSAFLLACADKGDSDSTGTADTNVPWVAVGEGLDAALLAVWGSAWDDVWVVGADPGGGGVLQHFDGSGWRAAGDLGAGDAWWVEGTEKTVWIAGAGGRLFRVDRASGVVIADQLDPSIVFFGIWAASDTEAWAVGGVSGVTENGAVMFHFDGTSWSPVELPAEAAAKATLFKVSGSSASDVWAVGEAGVALHFDGSAWSVVTTGVTPSLFGIRGRYAVGGNFTGTIVAWNGSGFVEETPPYAYQLSSVADDGVHTPTVVGYQGQVWLRGDLGWDLDPSETATLTDLHAVWIDPDGGTWAVGGHLSSAPLIHGVLVYKGARTIAPLESL